MRNYKQNKTKPKKKNIYEPNILLLLPSSNGFLIILTSIHFSIMTKDDIKLLLSEDLSPYKLTLLIVIHLYLCNELPIPQLITLTQLIENKQQPRPHNLLSTHNIIHSLSQLCELFNDMNVTKQLLKCIWRINSIEQLENDYINNLIKRVKSVDLITLNITPGSTNSGKVLSSKSLFGSFILKICTSFNSLKFDESFLLFQAFQQFREPTRQRYVELGGDIINENNNLGDDPDRDLFTRLNNNLIELGINNSISLSSLSSPTLTSTPTSTKIISVPKYDFQQLLDRQISLLETYGTPTPQYLKDIMMMMISPNSNVGRIQNIQFNNLPSYYYLRYLECLQISNYNEAFASLHQYFDYMVSNNSKYFYHFALISRASLHQYFGEDNKAMDAIEEAISVARENKDNSTLTYILSWLFNFMKNKPELWKNRQIFYNNNNNNNNNESQLLDFLIKKSKQISLLLYSMSYNFKTLYLLNNGDYQSCINSLIKSIFIAINDDVKSTFIKSAELAAIVWSKLGEPILSEVYNEIAIELTDSTIDQISLFIRLNFLKFLQGNNNINETYNQLQNMKNKVMITTDHSLYNAIQIRMLIILIKINLQKGKYNTSKEIINLLLDTDLKDLELKHEVLMLQVQLEMYLQNYSHALELLASMHTTTTTTTTSSSQIYLIIRLNLLKCKIFISSGNPYRVFTLLIQQIKIATKCGFGMIIIEAKLLLWKLLNDLKSFTDARKLGEEIMPQIFSLNQSEFIAIAYFELARSWSNDDDDDLVKSGEYIKIAIDRFKQNSDLVMLKQCLQYQVYLMNKYNQPQEMELANRLLNEITQELQNEVEQGYIYN